MNERIQAAIDEVAEQLEERGHGDLAMQLDQVTAADDEVTVDALVQAFGLEAEQAKQLADAIASAGNPKSVDAALDLANKLIGGHGVEAIRNPDRWDNYYHDIVALYVNMGDVYVMTVLYDAIDEKFVLSDYGTFIEDREKNFYENDSQWAVELHIEMADWEKAGLDDDSSDDDIAKVFPALDLFDEWEHNNYTIEARTDWPNDFGSEAHQRARSEFETLKVALEKQEWPAGAIASAFLILLGTVDATVELGDARHEGKLIKEDGEDVWFETDRATFV